MSHSAKQQSEYVEVDQERSLFRKQAQLLRHVELDVKQLERATMIREWASMSVSGIGLGYGKSILNFDGVGEPPLTLEQFTLINDVIEQKLPLVNNAILKSIYKWKKSVNEISTSTGLSRRKIDYYQQQALNQIYAVLCL